MSGEKCVKKNPGQSNVRKKEHRGVFREQGIRRATSGKEIWGLQFEGTVCRHEGKHAEKKTWEALKSRPWFQQGMGSRKLAGSPVSYLMNDPWVLASIIR